MLSSLSRSDEKQVRGVNLDACTRCIHYHGPSDVIAIRMRCCVTWYACIDCHRALADHPPELWPVQQWDQMAVLCGLCSSELSIEEYMASGHRCPRCGAAFNPGCRKHYHLYFETPAVS